MLYQRRNDHLQREFLRLLQDADPSIVERADVADVANEFAGYLATFTEAWAMNLESIGELERGIENWIESAAVRATIVPFSMYDEVDLESSTDERKQTSEE